MTDELNYRNRPETDADQVVENPVDELARIMGRNSDPAPLVEPVMAETTTAADLEAELMREFGIDSLSGQHETSVADVQVPEQASQVQEAPVMASEQARFVRQPIEQPNYQPASDSDDVLAEMVQYNVPNPVENSAAPVSTPVDNGAQLGGDNFANELELELAKLQHGLSDGLDAPEPVDQSIPVEPSFTQEAHKPLASQVFETPVSSEVASPVEVEPIAPTAAEIENAVVDMSAIVETDNDVEQTVEFDIPAVEPIAETVAPEAPFDVDLDSELEQEFSQIFADENLSNGVSDPNMATPDELPSETDQTVDSFFDMSAMNEDQPDVSPEASVVPVLLQPERIDVSQNQANWQDLQGANEAGNSSTGKFAAVGIFAFLILGAGGYFVYNNLASEGGVSNEPVIIKANNSPIKEVPADPGGTSVPNQDLAVYNQVEGNDTSVASQPSLVEATEEPLDIVQRTLDPSLLPLEGRELADKVEDRLVSGDQNNAGIADASIRPLIVPRKVRTVVVQADGTIITREAPAVVQPTQVESQAVDQTFSNQNVISEASSELLSAAAGQEVAVATDSAQQNSANTTTENQTNTETAAIAATPVARETQTPIATQPVAQPVENFAGYYMQIASQPSLAAAQSSYQNLVGRYNSVLGGRGVEYQKAEIAGKGTFHRVRIQVGERSDANSLCSRYKSAGGSCFVTK